MTVSTDLEALSLHFPNKMTLIPTNQVYFPDKKKKKTTKAEHLLKKRKKLQISEIMQ